MSLMDRNGKPLAIGDRVRTADGRVITIAGAMTNVQKANTVEKVEGHDQTKSAPATQSTTGDTVIWGT
jgi:hypothetical protein